MSDAKLKGSMYIATLDFIRERAGEEGVARVLARLPPDEQARLRELLLPIAWYPLAPFGRLLRAMDDELGAGDLELVTQRGVWAAKRDMTTVRRIILKLLTPTWIVERGMRLWPQFHDTGRWTVDAPGPGMLRASLHDLGVVDPAICASVRGWIAGLFVLSGQREIKCVHTRCRASGAGACLFETSWR